VILSRVRPTHSFSYNSFQVDDTAQVNTAGILLQNLHIRRSNWIMYRRVSYCFMGFLKARKKEKRGGEREREQEKWTSRWEWERETLIDSRVRCSQWNMILLLRILVFVNSTKRGKMYRPVTSQDGESFRETCGSYSHAFEEDAAIYATSCLQYSSYELSSF
jgi:hypothetical protein